MQQAQQVIQHKSAAYSADGVVVLLGISLTQWASVIGILVALGGLVLAYFTYRSNKWKNEQIVRSAQHHNEKMEDITRQRMNDYIE